MIVETRKRTLAKSLTWRVFATLVVVICSFIVTGDVILSTLVGGLDAMFKSVAYYIHERFWSSINYGRENKKTKGCVLWLTGLSGSGKTTLADSVAGRLRALGHSVRRIDGDIARATFSKDLGFSKKDRDENNRRAARLASYLENDSITIVSFISPYQEQRDFARKTCNNFYEIFLKCSVDTCERRDVKGLYAKARRGEISSFTGIHEDAPYEIPEMPDFAVNTDYYSIGTSTQYVIEWMKKKELI